MKSLPRVLILSVILIYYILIATCDTFDFNIKADHNTLYNQLTDAFLKGKVHMLFDPPEELLKLKDPYDPVQNEPFRYMCLDLSLYKGKFYSYFGLPPLFLVYLPYRMISHLKAPDSLPVILFLFGSLIVSTLLLLDVRNRYFKNTPDWMLNFSILILGFSNLGPYLLRKPLMYEVALTCGLFFITLTIYFFSRILNGHYKHINFFLSGLFFILSIASRPTLIFCGVIISYLFYELIFKNKFSFKLNLSRIICFFFPIVLISIALGYYNYIRFDNFFDFGFQYQIAPVSKTRSDMFGVKYVLRNINYYFFCLPMFISEFPYVRLNVFTPTKEFHLNYYELAVGLFPAVPFLLNAPIGLFFYVKAVLQKINQIKLPRHELLLCSFFIILELSLVLFYAGFTLRYSTNIATLMILIAVIFWFYLNDLFKNNTKNELIKGSGVLLGGMSIMLGVIFSVPGKTAWFFLLFSIVFMKF